MKQKSEEEVEVLPVHAAPLFFVRSYNKNVVVELLPSSKHLRRTLAMLIDLPLVLALGAAISSMAFSNERYSFDDE